MDEPNPPKGDVPVLLHYHGRRQAAPKVEAVRGAAPIPVIPAIHGHNHAGARIKWLGFTLIAIGTAAYLLHWMHDPGRAYALRAQCAANLRTIGTACFVYADQHDGKYPANFSDMLRSTGVTSDIFVCPNTYDTPAQGTIAEQAFALSHGGHLSYIWLGKPVRVNPAPETVLAVEPLGNHNNTGMHVLFTDGHVEWLNAPEAQHLIDSIIPGDPTLWPPAGSKP